MRRIVEFSDVWDNGQVTLASLAVMETREFKERTGATKVIGRQWEYENVIFKMPYFLRVLPDQTGLVMCENNLAADIRLIVFNGDGKKRVAIDVPCVDVNSKPNDGYLALPPSSSRFGGIEWGVEGNDGFDDYLFDFDWNTGKLLGYAKPTRPW